MDKIADAIYWLVMAFSAWSIAWVAKQIGADDILYVVLVFCGFTLGMAGNKILWKKNKED